MIVCLDLEKFNSESLKMLAYALLHGGPEMPGRRSQMDTWRTAKLAIEELDGRGRDISELHEMLQHWRAGIDARRSIPGGHR